MMRNRIRATALLSLLSFSLYVRAEGEWTPSTLSDTTIAKVTEAKAAYGRCLDEELRKALSSDADPRALADAIMKTCEGRLGPISAAHDAEKVPAAITERYLRQIRSRGAQGLLREIMATQAVRQSSAETAKPAK